MKRAIIIFVVAVLVLFTTGLWLFEAGGLLSRFDFLTIGIIVILVAFAAYIGFRRMGSARRGEPQEDELSKKVLQRTAAVSYYISLYLWVGVLFIKDRVTLDSEELIGAGILGMAITWAACWAFFNFRGVGNA